MDDGKPESNELRKQQSEKTVKRGVSKLGPKTNNMQKYPYARVSEDGKECSTKKEHILRQPRNQIEKRFWINE
jgi:hypothetical protein